MSPTVAAVLACKGAEAEAENTIQQALIECPEMALRMALR